MKLSIKHRVLRNRIIYILKRVAWEDRPFSPCVLIRNRLFYRFFAKFDTLSDGGKTCFLV